MNIQTNPIIFLSWDSHHLLTGGESVGNDQHVTHPELVTDEIIETSELTLLHLFQRSTTRLVNIHETKGFTYLGHTRKALPT